MSFQNASVESATPAWYVSFANVTSRGTIAMPSEAARAGSKSDAESVPIATRLTAGPPSQVAASPGLDDTGPGTPPDDPPGDPPGAPSWRPPPPARLGAHGSFLVGRAGRHVHPALQHGPDGGDAHVLPGRAAQAPRRPGPAARAGRRHPHRRFRVRGHPRLVLRVGAPAVAAVRRPLGPAGPLAGDAVRPVLR